MTKKKVGIDYAKEFQLVSTHDVNPNWPLHTGYQWWRSGRFRIKWVNFGGMQARFDCTLFDRKKEIGLVYSSYSYNCIPGTTPKPSARSNFRKNLIQMIDTYLRGEEP